MRTIGSELSSGIFFIGSRVCQGSSSQRRRESAARFSTASKLVLKELGIFYLRRSKRFTMASDWYGTGSFTTGLTSQGCLGRHRNCHLGESWAAVTLAAVVISALAQVVCV